MEAAHVVEPTHEVRRRYVASARSVRVTVGHQNTRCQKWCEIMKPKIHALQTHKNTIGIDMDGRKKHRDTAFHLWSGRFSYPFLGGD